MKYIYHIILVLLSTSCDFHSAEDYFKQAVKLEKEGDFKRAILFHNKALKKNSKATASLINRGSDKSELGDYNGAIVDFEKILDYDKNNTLALYAIGDTYSELKNYPKAIIFYTRALQSEGIIKNLTLNQTKNSIDFSSDNNQYNVQDYYIYFERGIAYLENKQFDKAITDLKTSLLNQNGVADCYFLLGKCYVGKKDLTTACKNFTQSARLGDKEAKEQMKKHCL